MMLLQLLVLLVCVCLKCYISLGVHGSGKTMPSGRVGASCCCSCAFGGCAISSPAKCRRWGVRWGVGGLNIAGRCVMVCRGHCNFTTCERGWASGGGGGCGAGGPCANALNHCWLGATTCTRHGVACRPQEHCWRARWQSNYSYVLAIVYVWIM